jgi:transcriptional regulator with XRE-family HTH domain
MISREEICSLFGQLLAQRRAEAKLSQEALAKSVGLTRTSITNIERGRQPVNLHTLYVMADILRLEVADLLPSLPSKSIASPIPREQLQKLSTRERKQLDRLGSKDFNWLAKIARSKPPKAR